MISSNKPSLLSPPPYPFIILYFHIFLNTKGVFKTPFYAETSERVRRLSLRLSALYQLTLTLALSRFQLTFGTLPS